MLNWYEISLSVTGKVFNYTFFVPSNIKLLFIIKKKNNSIDNTCEYVCWLEAAKVVISEK